ncbi:MAG TPA: hypothetical protein VFP17_05205, partial [Solirubrobacterales bacterium]|nr:hypothetical protein [Solirubrobacterales bacterium]
MSLASKPFDQEISRLPPLVHGFTAEDWLACWNMQRAGTLVNLDFANEIEFQKPGIRCLAMEDLRNGSFGEVDFTPRMLCLWQAAMIRSGGWIGEGVPPYPTRKASKQESERVVRQAGVELRMEEARRHLAPNAPSRIGCLYLAEDSAAGRNMVSRLKGQDAFLMRVRVKYCLRVARADSQWLDENAGDEEIAGYWRGDPRNDDPIW